MVAVRIPAHLGRGASIFQPTAVVTATTPTITGDDRNNTDCTNDGRAARQPCGGENVDLWQ